MDKDVILKEQHENGITIITFNRPERHNAFDDVFIKRFTEELYACNDDDTIKIILIKANGKNFSAGADIEWMKRMLQFTEEENFNDALQLANLLKELKNTPKITIALAKGTIMGGGVGLLACCDMVIADDQTRFCFSEAKLGLVPATIAPYVIQAIGSRAAKYYFLTAKSFNSLEAKEIGLVQEIVKHDQLVASGIELANSLLKNGPHALPIIKQLVSKIMPYNESLIIETAELIASVRCSSEAQEGLSAFLEKRETSWVRSLDKME